MNVVQIPNVYPKISTSNILVMEWLEGIRLSDHEALNRLTINREELAKKLIKLFLPQWLEPGIFHADPHTGNVMVSKEGKIILLDFGMIGEITKKDAAYFQELIICFLTKNYSKAVDCLANLGFLLPGTDKRTIERLLAEFATFQPEQLKEMDLLALKLELNDLIHSLPIQVPTRFVFLGRSFVTIEGIIKNLAPEEELFDLVKPVFMKWLITQGNSNWSFIWQWIQSQSIFKIFHSVTELLNVPEKLEKLKEMEQRRQFQFKIHENNKNRLFQLTLLGFAGIAFGIHGSDELILKLSTGISTIAIIGFFICSKKKPGGRF